MKNIFESKIFRLIFWILFPAAVYYGSGAVVGLFFKSVAQYIFGSPELLDEVWVRSLIFLASFATMTLAMIKIPEVIFGRKISKKTIGAEKPLTYADFGWGTLGLVVSMILGGVLLAVLAIVFPEIDAQQSQEIGLSSPKAWTDLIFIFVSLTILPAFFEEVMFRGVIYGQLREVFGSKMWIFALILSSVLFGAAHGQWNVGVVTFAMGVVACFMREKITDSIWAGVILHFSKNFIAFAVIYLLPIFMFLIR